VIEADLIEMVEITISAETVAVIQVETSEMIAQTTEADMSDVAEITISEKTVAVNLHGD
jgi:hypothetical protein